VISHYFFLLFFINFSNLDFIDSNNLALIISNDCAFPFKEQWLNLLLGQVAKSHTESSSDNIFFRQQ